MSKRRQILRRAPAATVSDVARSAGVSTATVSRAFSHPGVVAEETRLKVLQAARELRFHPNLAARALRTGELGLVGLVLPPRHVVSEFYAELLAGFHDTAAGAQIKTALSIMPEDAEPYEWLQELVFSGWCSAIALHFEILHDLPRLDELGIPVVLLNYVPPVEQVSRRVSTIGFDNWGGALQAVRHLVELGHHRIAHLAGSEESADTIARLGAYREGMTSAGLEVHSGWILHCGFQEGPVGGEAAYRRLFENSTAPPPTAVFCASDDIALGALNAARKLGHEVPQDVSIVGFDNTRWAAYLHPPLTSVHHRGWELGSAVAEELISLKEGKSPLGHNILLPTSLVVRGSSASPPEAS